METPEIEIEHVKVRLYPDGRMTRRDAARYVGLSEKTLAMLASKGGGPHYVKRGKIFYYQADLDKWLKEGLITSTAQLSPTSIGVLAKPITQTTPHRAKAYTSGRKK